MKKTRFAALALLVAMTAAGCTPKTSSSNTPSGNGLSRQEADALVAGFEKSLSGTVKLTYTADYTLDVVSESASAKGFARDIEDVTEITADFTAGNYYLHAKRVGYNKFKEEEKSTVEALVWKDGDTYKYLESTMGSEATLADEAAAVAKIAELMASVSKREGGYVTPQTLVYDGINKYEHREFLFSSKTVTVEDYFDDPVMNKTEDNGIKVESALQYVGYATDGGTSELSANPGANTVVITDAKGYVTSYVETFNDATLEMPIMTPAPVLHLTGEKKLEATYGATIERLTTIDHHATNGTIIIPANEKGKVEVFTCAPYAFTAMTKIRSGAEAPVGNWLCVKVTPAGSNTILNVSYAGKSETLVDPAQAGGYYCFTVVEGENSVVVNFEGSDTIPQVANITVDTTGANATYKGAVWFTLTNGAPGAMTPITDGTAPIGENNWVAISLEVEEGYEVDTVTCNGANSFFMSGFHCFRIAEAGDYPIVVTTKAAVENAIANVTVNLEGAEATLAGMVWFDLVNGAPNGFTPVENGQAPAAAGRWVAIQLAVNAGFVVDTVTCNGAAAFVLSGYYCFKIETAGDYPIVVTTKAA